MRKNDVQEHCLVTARMTIDGTTKKEGEMSRVAVGERERAGRIGGSRNAIKQPEDHPVTFNDVGKGRRGRGKETPSDGKRKRGHKKDVDGWTEEGWRRDQVGH